MKLNEGFLNSMREAMTLLRTQGPVEATEAIQRALRGGVTDEASHATAHERVVSPSARSTAKPVRQPTADVEDRGHFGTHTFSNAAGSRQYRLYVPADTSGGPLPLIVMLHGCTQDADDFAAGTQMNALAERHRCLVAYPVQPQQANPSKCWNWFKPGDQHRDQGEPSLIAGITRQIMSAHDVDPARVYVAGMSAGGAMAAIMIETFADLYAAAGVHSGLAAGSAHDLPSALAAMKGGKARKGRAGSHAMSESASPQRPLIVFHGDADSTVHVANATRLIHGFEARHGEADRRTSDTGRRASTLTKLVSRDGVEGELWVVHGGSHAWSGGDARGSYTDPNGPNASAEMLRFFLEHPKKG